MNLKPILAVSTLLGASDEDARVTCAKWREQWKERGSPRSSRGIREPRSSTRLMCSALVCAGD